MIIIAKIYDKWERNKDNKPSSTCLLNSLKIIRNIIKRMETQY